MTIDIQYETSHIFFEKAQHGFSIEWNTLCLFLVVPHEDLKLIMPYDLKLHIYKIVLSGCME